MDTKLPARPNLDHLRSQAKTLAKRTGRRLAAAQLDVAREWGFLSWPRLARHVDDLRRLEGRWSFTRLEVDGNPMPAAMFDASALLIDGDRFRMESAEATYEGIFTIDAETTPHQIDIEFVEGPEAGNWSYGIYELDGDRLVLCLGLTGAPRPKQFATAAGSGHALEHLTRASQSRPANLKGGRAQPTRSSAPPAAIDESAFALRMTPLLDRLQGEWTPASLISSGQPLAPAMLAYGSRTMTGNETKVVFGGQTMVHARIRLDESASPVAVDYLNIGRGPKAITRGILEWVGADVRFCMAAAGAPRPDEFSCDKGSGRTMSQWRLKT